MDSCVTQEPKEMTLKTFSSTNTVYTQTSGIYKSTVSPQISSSVRVQA